MARTWLSIRVELVEGRGERFWPRPGRIFAAARRHTFAQLAEAIDDAFARWDRAHLHDFTVADGTRLTTPYVDWEEAGPALDDRRTTLARLRAGEQFVYDGESSPPEDPGLADLPPLRPWRGPQERWDRS